MRSRTAMLEISWLPRSLGRADASFWPANVCVCPPLDKGFRPTDPPITFSTCDSHAGASN